MWKEQGYQFVEKNNKQVQKKAAMYLVAITLNANNLVKFTKKLDHHLQSNRKSLKIPVKL